MASEQSSRAVWSMQNDVTREEPQSYKIVRSYVEPIFQPYQESSTNSAATNNDDNNTKYDKEIIDQLLKFGHKQQDIIQAMDEMNGNEYDINMIMDMIETNQIRNIAKNDDSKMNRYVTNEGKQSRFQTRFKFRKTSKRYLKEPGGTTPRSPSISKDNDDDSKNEEASPTPFKPKHFIIILDTTTPNKMRWTIQVSIFNHISHSEAYLKDI